MRSTDITNHMPASEASPQSDNPPTHRADAAVAVQCYTTERTKALQKERTKALAVGGGAGAGARSFLSAGG
jgi:hypothetical protein